MCDLLLAVCLSVYGPGAISAADPGVLERVASRRLANNWGLEADWRGYEVLVAPADCRLLGRTGWLIANGNPQRGRPLASSGHFVGRSKLVPGAGVYTAIVVDCENGKHAGQMEERGLLVDINKPVELVHLEGWLVLK